MHLKLLEEVGNQLGALATPAIPTLAHGCPPKLLIDSSKARWTSMVLPSTRPSLSFKFRKRSWKSPPACPPGLHILGSKPWKPTDVCTLCFLPYCVLQEGSWRQRPGGPWFHQKNKSNRQVRQGLSVSHKGTCAERALVLCWSGLTWVRAQGPGHLSQACRVRDKGWFGAMWFRVPYLPLVVCPIPWAPPMARKEAWSL